MPTWYFRGKQLPAGGYEWYWEIESDEAPIAITSTRVFSSLEECIAHAREHGFFGAVDVPDTITYPAFIACEATERRSNPARGTVSGRANRPAR